MRIGGMRKLKKSPHLSYGAHSLPQLIPAIAALTLEVLIIEERKIPTQ